MIVHALTFWPSASPSPSSASFVKRATLWAPPRRDAHVMNGVADHIRGALGTRWNLRRQACLTLIGGRPFQLRILRRQILETGPSEAALEEKVSNVGCDC